MNKLFGNNFIAGRGGLGLLAVRLVFGAGLILHGVGKIQHPMNWMGPGSPVPGFLQALSALSEFGGGFALILGLLTPLAALGIVCNMLVAIFMVHVKHGDPFISKPGGHSWESAAGYLAIGLLLLFTGPGALSLDALIFGGKRRR